MDHMMMQFSFKGQRLFPDANNNGKEKGDKYQLRPRGRAPRAERPRRPAARARPAPLSKYRRKTANARERERMREINQAFEALRRCVPPWAVAPGPAPCVAPRPTPWPAASATPSGEKLTKITTLRLAMRYIGSLAAALREPPFPRARLASPRSASPLSADLGLPDSPPLSSPEPGSPLRACLSPLDFGSPSLLADAFTDPGLAGDAFSDYFLA